MEGLQNRKHMLQKKDYMWKLDLKDTFLAICSLPLVRKLVRVPFPFLCFGTITANIHKIVKGANDNLTQDKHQNYNLLRRHVIDWSLEPRHSNLSSATSRICHKNGKSLCRHQCRK